MSNTSSIKYKSTKRDFQYCRNSIMNTITVDDGRANKTEMNKCYEKLFQNVTKEEAIKIMKSELNRSTYEQKIFADAFMICFLKESNNY